jgi:hypothetical protein
MLHRAGTGWPDEFVKKNAQNVAQTIIVKKTFTVGEKYPKNVGCFGSFQKNCPK